MNGRLGKEEYYLEIARVVSKRGTCLRRAVGCVLIDKEGHILSTGYNGVCKGSRHCNEEHLEESWKTGKIEITYPYRCIGANSPSGKDLDLCLAIHAEQNALLQCGDVNSIDSCFTTASPCIHCVKLLMNTSCKKIIYEELYSEDALKLWGSMGRRFHQLRK